jgi:hypothetical protein
MAKEVEEEEEVVEEEAVVVVVEVAEAVVVMEVMALAVALAMVQDMVLVREEIMSTLKRIVLIALFNLHIIYVTFNNNLHSDFGSYCFMHGRFYILCIMVTKKFKCIIIAKIL